MQKSVRRRLFYALVAVFLVLGTGIAFYADGWRFDFGTRTFEKVGEIYVRAYPADVAITLDGKPIQSGVGFISRGTLITDLLPRTYSLRLTKNGFLPWQEQAAVSPSVVTEFKYAVMIPQQAIMVSYGPFINVIPTPYGLVTQSASGTIIQNGHVIARGGAITFDPSFSTNLLVRQGPRGPYLNIDLTDITEQNLSTLFTARNISLTAAATVMQNADAVFALNSGHLWIMDAHSENIVFTARPSGTIIFEPSLATGPSGAVWTGYAASKNVTTAYNYRDASMTASPSQATVPGRTTRITRLTDTTFGILQNTGELYSYDIQSQIFTKIADDAVNAALSQDSGALAVLERKGIEIFSPSTNDYWRFNLPAADTIRDIIWYHDGRHLFVVYPERVAFLDLADAHLVNFTTVGNGILPAYDRDANVLYLLDNERNIVRYDFPN